MPRRKRNMKRNNNNNNEHVRTKNIRSKGKTSSNSAINRNISGWHNSSKRQKNSKQQQKISIHEN